VDLVTDWKQRHRSHAYLVYDGNESTAKESFPMRKFKFDGCPHFSDSDIGDPYFASL
jgi:hypothetical protein